MNTPKKTAFGIIGVAATAAALAFGAAAPAMAGAADGGDHRSTSQYSTHWINQQYWNERATHITGGDVSASNESPIVVAPQVHTGDILSGDVANGNSVGNGTLSGNEVGNVSGNEVASGNAVGSGNDTAIGSGNHTSVGIDDLIDSTVGDVTGDVSHLLGDLSLDTMFED